jgi:hypothetical protein
VIRIVLVCAVALAGGAGRVAAHEGEGVITIESGEVTGLTATYQIRLTWQNDGHPALDATVTATARRAADGQAQTPVPMSPVDEDGRYRGAIELTPGDWTVRFTSVTPQGTTEVPLSVVAPTTTTVATTTTAPPSSSTTGSVTVSEEDDSGLSTGAVVGLVAVGALAVGGVTAAVIARRRR